MTKQTDLATLSAKLVGSQRWPIATSHQRSQGQGARASWTEFNDPPLGGFLLSGVCMQRKTWLAIALTAVAGFEGLRTMAYRDPIGLPTICFGHTADVQLGDTKTEAECNQLLTDEVVEFGLEVSNMVTVPLSHREQAAYTSFAYNVGIGAFGSSTLLRKLNAGDRVGACNELSRWVYARGMKLPGLVKRRAEERELCLSGLKQGSN